MKAMILAVMCAAAASAQTSVQTGVQTGVYTHSGDNDRSGVYQSTITVAGLKAKGVVRRTTVPVIGDARGMEGQPLILPGVTVSGALCRDADGGSINCPSSVHDVMVLPSMANVVRGVDAHTGVGLWQTTLGTPVNGGASIDMHLINQHWGVLSTAVIDPATQLVYMVAWISPDGTPQRGVHWMYTLSVATGAIVRPPVSFATLPNYGQTMRKQRCALGEATIAGRPTIFGCWGTVLETGQYAAGAVFAFDTLSNSWGGFLQTSQGRGAGVWQGGQGLNIDKAGNLYLVTGNGSFNGVTDFGESMLELRYTPPVGSAAGSIAVSGHFAPYSDSGRIGEDPTQSDVASALAAAKLAGASQPTEDMTQPVGGGMAISMIGAKAAVAADVNTGAAVVVIYPADARDAAWNDEDLGSAGCALVEQYGYLVCSGKDGIAYVVKTSAWPNNMPADFANIPAVCAKLASPPVWAAASPGPVNPCPQDTTTLNFMPWGKTRHLHMTPVQYQDPAGNVFLFFWGENSTLHKWALSPAGALTYVAESNEVASVESTAPPGGMPGGFCSLGTNGFKAGTSVLWCSIPYGNGNAQITNGRLLAYDPENLTANGHLQVLWDSQQWGIPYVFNKFMPPVLYGDEVILPDYNGGVQIFGAAN